MTHLQQHLQKISQALGLHCEIPYSVSLKSGLIVADALIKDLGGSDGTLIFTSVESFWNKRNEIEPTYGYSVLPEDALWDIESYIGIFSEWGWSSPDKPEPVWLLSEEELEKYYSDDK